MPKEPELPVAEPAADLNLTDTYTGQITYNVAYTPGNVLLEPVWIYWNNQYIQANVSYDAGTTSVAGNIIWVSWNASSFKQYQQAAIYTSMARERTPQEIEADRVWMAQHQEQLQEQINQHQEQINQHQEQIRLAIRKAEQLLFMCLTVAQKASYTAHGYFETVVNDRRYRINSNARSGNVKLMDEITGNAVVSFCIHPHDTTLPIPDVMLAQKLLLESNEAEFLSVANATQMSARGVDIEAIRRALVALERDNAQVAYAA